MGRWTTVAREPRRAVFRPMTCQNLAGPSRQTPRQETVRAVRIVLGHRVTSRMRLLPAHRTRLLV